MAKGSKVAEAYKVEEILKTLDRSGAAKYFFHIKRRVPGKHIFPFWKRNLPVENIEDIRAFCYEQGGEEYDYKIQVLDGDGRPVPNIPDTLIEALKPMDDIDSQKDATMRSPMAGVLKQRQDDLLLQRQELIVQQQEAALEKERKRLAKQKSGADDEDDDDAPVYNPYAHPYMMGPYGQQGMGYNPYAPPWMQQQNQNQQGKADPNVAAMAEAFKAMAGQQKQDSSLELLKILVPLLVGGRKDLDPKDMMNMVLPLVTEAGKASQEGNKILMASMADMDKAFRGKLLDMIMNDPNREPDEVERIKKWLNLGTETLKDGVRAIFGRDTVMPSGPAKKTVALPPPAGKTPAAGALPAPAPEAPVANPAPAEDTPRGRAQKLIAIRVQGFLDGLEQEAHIGSDPALVVEKVEELYLLLPLPLRVKMATAADAFEALNTIAPESVKRILADVAADQAGTLKGWYEEFFMILNEEPEDEDDGGDDDEDDGEPEEGPDAPVPAEDVKEAP